MRYEILVKLGDEDNAEAIQGLSEYRDVAEDEARGALLSVGVIESAVFDVRNASCVFWTDGAQEKSRDVGTGEVSIVELAL